MGLLSKLLLVATLMAPDLDPTAQEVKDLFDQAAVQYDTAEYKGAVRLFTEAYRRSADIPDKELRELVQAAIFFNLARAHSKTYRLDKDPEHLLQAEDLLTKYLGQTADLADKQDAEQFLSETRQELARLEALAQAEAEAAAASQPAQDPEDLPTGRGLIGTGATFLTLGILGGGTAIAGAVLTSQANQRYVDGPTREDRDDAVDRGNLGNTMILAGSISAGVLITSGIIMTAVGAKRRGRLRSMAWATPEGAGLTLTGRF